MVTFMPSTLAILFQYGSYPPGILTAQLEDVVLGQYVADRAGVNRKSWAFVSHTSVTPVQ